MLFTFNFFFWALCLFSVFRASSVAAVPFALHGPGVNPEDFEVSVFASGLDFPLGLAELPDGSIIATVMDDSASFWSGQGKLIRLLEVADTGVAAPAQTLYSGLSASLTAVHVAGDLVFVTGGAMPLTILRMGAQPSDPLSFVGEIDFDYSDTQTYHSHSALELRETPGGSAGSYDLFFQIGSARNQFATPPEETVTISSASVDGVAGSLRRDSIHKLTLLDHGTHLEMIDLVQTAAGLRNAAGIVVHPTTGDLYFIENGIDLPSNQNTPLSADELNRIAREEIGASLPDFGFPDNYTSYPDGGTVGSGGVEPLVVFLPETDAEDPELVRLSEGSNGVVFAPPGFPEGLNRGVFIGFHGKFNEGGLNNDENPLIYADPQTGDYFHFIRGQQAGIGHLLGSLSTRDALYVADLATGGNVGSAKGEGVIYKIRSLSPEPPHLQWSTEEDGLQLIWDRGRLYEALDLNGDWTAVDESFSPHAITPDGGQRFFRVGY